jgi:hypothetical protein
MPMMKRADLKAMLATIAVVAAAFALGAVYVTFVVGRM